VINRAGTDLAAGRGADKGENSDGVFFAHDAMKRVMGNNCCDFVKAISDNRRKIYRYRLSRVRLIAE
jgi:hypothetical protein